MKKIFKVPLVRLFGIIALIAIFGLSMSACKDDDTTPAPSSGGGGLTAPTGLTATAYSSSGIAVNWNAVPGATGYKVYNGLTSEVAFVGNVDSNSAFNINLPANTTIYYRVSAFNSSGEGPRSNVVSAKTLADNNFSLNGTWELGGSNNIQVTVSGNTGVMTRYTPVSAIQIDASNKGFYKVGSTVWKDLSSTGNYTWSGQLLHFTINSSGATGTVWYGGTFTMSANGQSLTIYNSYEGGTVTYTRR